VKEYANILIGKQSVLTARTGGGVTSFLLHLCAEFSKNDLSVLFYAPSMGLDREFVKKYYPLVLTNTTFMESATDISLEFMDSIEKDTFDVLIVDPGDTLLSKRFILPAVISMGKFNTHIFSSQIRQKPTGQVYSTLEVHYDFDWYMWLLKVSEPASEIKRRYLDIFKTSSVTYDNLENRFVLSFGPEGNIIN
jgi:hypothetical protein